MQKLLVNNWTFLTTKVVDNNKILLAIYLVSMFSGERKTVFSPFKDARTENITMVYTKIINFDKT